MWNRHLKNAGKHCNQHVENGWVHGQRLRHLSKKYAIHQVRAKNRYHLKAHPYRIKEFYVRYVPTIIRRFYIARRDEAKISIISL